MFLFIKSHKNIFIKITSVILAVTLAVLCAAIVLQKTEIALGELSSHSYTQDIISVSSDSTDIQTESLQTITSQIAPPPPKIINAYLPYEKQTLAAGASFDVIAAAKYDSASVTATFNGQTIALEKQTDSINNEFVDFKGSFTLPTGNEYDINLGGVTFYAEWQGHSAKYTSPSIICLRDTALDRITVVEVVADTAETFDGNTTNDNSDPRLSYLPKGTIDYRVGNVIYDKKSENHYYKLRFGRRVYVDKKNPPDDSRIKITTAYEGTVPDTNEISFESSKVNGCHTYFTFNTEWKAPFTLDLTPQSYNNPSIRDFTVQSATYSCVDIKFCYTSQIGGDITALADNPLFSSAQVVAAQGGYILRLNLKKVGAFYGWDCYYNENGQLVFKFLNPKVILPADNEYGVNLNGATIMLDVGHGGKDPGAEGILPNTMFEAERNLNLANKLRAELEKMGANVVMTRYDDTAVTSEGRCAALRKASPDLCVSIHHDSAERQSANGCGIYCFNAFSHNATQKVFEHTANSGIYSETYKEWHYFYLARVTCCPVVLTENGFISSPLDFNGISNDAVNTKKAKAIAHGVAEYFKTIQ